MGNRLFVGNLSYSTSDQELREEFSKCGSITYSRIITDRETGRSKGFGFVEFATEAEAQAAIQALDGAIVGGRNIAVRVAEERAPQRPQGPSSAAPSGEERPASFNHNNNFGPDKAKRGSYDKSKKKGRRRDESDWG